MKRNEQRGNVLEDVGSSVHGDVLILTRRRSTSPLDTGAKAERMGITKRGLRRSNEMTRIKLLCKFKNILKGKAVL